MKKILLFGALLAFCSNFAQVAVPDAADSEKDGPVTLSVYGSVPELNQIGLSVEFLGKYKKDMLSKRSFYTSKIANLAYGMMNYEEDGLDIDGSGFVVEIGSRTYYKSVDEGLYMSNYLSYGNIKFDDTVFGLEADGTYSYFSFFSPEVGYKIKFSGISIDPFAGIMWKLEIKGKGVIDNRNVNEWAPRIGLKVGYQF